jgi:hypothetical protein
MKVLSKLHANIVCQRISDTNTCEISIYVILFSTQPRLSWLHVQSNFRLWEGTLIMPDALKPKLCKMPNWKVQTPNGLMRTLKIPGLISAWTMTGRMK